MRIPQTIAGILAWNKLSPETSLFGPFSLCSQRRWRKPTVNAQTRLEDRTRDSKLDKLTSNISTLKTILGLESLMSTRKRGPFTSVQLMTRWRSIVGLNVSIGSFIHKYPHVFEVFTHPIERNLCCRITHEMKGLMEAEERAVRNLELDLVKKLKKLLMMSVNGRLHIHALRLIRRELGLPSDFRESILAKYSEDFRLVSLEVVELVDRDEDLGVAEVEKWREKEYTEKWLSEFETKYAFPINFPTGFEIKKGMREKMKNWQRLPYVKPYEKKDVVRMRTCGGLERFEKRAVAIIHELLNLTVEKMVEVERLVHFKKEFAMEVNIRELLLKHPGIFYISTKGSSQTLLLREAYSKGCLVEPNPIYAARRNMLELILLGRRNTKVPSSSKETRESRVVSDRYEGKARDGDWVLPILESVRDHTPYARAVVQRFGEAFEEGERNSGTSKTQDVEGLIEEVQEARRIKLMHQPSKLTLSKRAEENKSRLYVLDGSESLGSVLHVRPRLDNAPALSKCLVQCYQTSCEGTHRDVISGANRPSYAPEPLDVGRILQAEISINGQRDTVTTAGPIDSVAGLESHVESLTQKSNAEFSVTISQMNGQDHSSHSTRVFHVGKMRVKLSREWITKAREIFSTSMQLCGVRSDSSKAAKGLFWQARKGLSFVLTFESERDRNAAIMLARRYALDCNVMLAGPDDLI